MYMKCKVERGECFSELSITCGENVSKCMVIPSPGHCGAGGGYRWLHSTVVSKLDFETEVGTRAEAIATYDEAGEVEMLLGEQIVYGHFVLVETRMHKV